jgi:plastocyanin
LTRVTTPNGHTSANSFNDLFDVGGAAGDAWAVGRTETLTSHEAPLILHWDGSVWKRLSNPADPGSSDYSLAGVTQVSSSRAWAVGSFNNGTRDVPMVLRWNGSSWSVVTGVPKPGTGNARLLSVRALSSNDVWAVGFFVQSGHAHTLILHFDGSTWSHVSSPDFFSDNILNGVGIRARDDVWAVGTTDDSSVGGPVNTLILHWDGTSWRQVVSPNRTPTNDRLRAVAVVEGGSNVWAVGDTNQTLAMSICPVRVSDDGVSPDSATVDVGSLVAWALPVANVQNHTVTDDSGLGQFDSGPLTNGASFVHTFGAAGSHPVIDTVTGNTSTIDVLPTVDPTSGGGSTSFLVTWATHDSTAPFVHDVQVKGPSDGSFMTWMNGVTNGDGGFIPNGWQGGEGPGVYKFRARLRNSSTGAKTGWSPAVTITVS